MHMRLPFVRCAIATLVLLSSPSLGAADDALQPFIGSWRLLNTEQKQYFISGYLRGMEDAAQLTEITIEYVQQNPKDAKKSLGELKALYHYSQISAIDAVTKIDAFYANPENTERPLSAALSTIRRRP